MCLLVLSSERWTKGQIDLKVIRLCGDRNISYRFLLTFANQIRFIVISSRLGENDCVTNVEENSVLNLHAHFDKKNLGGQSVNFEEILIFRNFLNPSDLMQSYANRSKFYAFIIFFEWNLIRIVRQKLIQKFSIPEFHFVFSGEVKKYVLL